MLEGCRRSRAKPDTRAPITLAILTKICNVLMSVCYSEFEAKMFKAAFVLAYFGLLRVGELALSTTSPEPLQKSYV